MTVLPNSRLKVYLQKFYFFENAAQFRNISRNEWGQFQKSEELLSFKPKFDDQFFNNTQRPNEKSSLLAKRV